MKYSVNPQIGEIKYSISFHRIGEKHKDGSPFWGIKTYKTKKDLMKGIKKFKDSGFRTD